MTSRVVVVILATLIVLLAAGIQARRRVAAIRRQEELDGNTAARIRAVALVYGAFCAIVVVIAITIAQAH